MALSYLRLWIFKFVFFFVGCSACFLLQSHLKASAVLAAALTGFVGTFIPQSRHIDSVHVHACIYMGAFVAMGSQMVIANLWQILGISLIGSTIYLLGSPFLKGLGGRLGFIAFVSSLLGFLMRQWL